jgi:hypothetical protein
MERIGHLEKREDQRSQIVAVGTLACPECDAPVAPGPAALAPHEPLACPVCGHDAAVRDFLSLAPPTRPARVAVRVSLPRVA